MRCYKTNLLCSEEQLCKPSSDSESVSSSKPTLEEISKDSELGLIIPKSILNPKLMSNLDESSSKSTVDIIEEIMVIEEDADGGHARNDLNHSKTLHKSASSDFAPKEEVIYEVLYQNDEINERDDTEIRDISKYRKVVNGSPERSIIQKFFDSQSYF